jgi:purine nucleosidase
MLLIVLIIVLILITLIACVYIPNHRTNVIIDCDPGIDDTLALLFALRNERLNILGITCCFGNISSVEQIGRNVYHILELTNRTDIPIYLGATKPLDGSIPESAGVHGEYGLGNSRITKNAPEQSENASEAIIRLCNTYEDVNIITMGPLTNIALAMIKDPNIPIKSLHCMVGAVNHPGNITPVAEANAWYDPEAVEIVLNNCNVTIAPLNVTKYMVMDYKKRTKIGRCNNSIKDYLQYYSDFYFKLDQDPVLHDIVPILSLLHPSLFTYEYGKITVGTSAEVSVDLGIVTSDDCATKILTGIDVNKAWKEIFKYL